jgi:hypothetical protein
MRRLLRRRSTTLLIAAALIAAVAIAIFLRAKSPPEAARLLPESDALVYVHLKTLRTFTHFDASPVQRMPDYQGFIEATGINPERDIDSFAVALHRLPNASGPNGPVGYSEVFIGRFDLERLNRYLAGMARAQESYAGKTVYSIPVEGRTLRIAQLGYDTVAASNMPTAEQIHSMLDRSRASALGSSGSSLLNARFRDVPLLSVMWGIGHIGLPFAEHGKLTVLGLELPLPEDADLVASVRYHGKVQLRCEEFAPDPLAAQHTVDALNPLLGILRGIADAQPAQKPADAALREALGSATLESKGSHVLLTASVGLDPLTQWLTAPPPVVAPQTSPAPPDTAPVAKPASNR